MDQWIIIELNYLSCLICNYFSTHNESTCRRGGYRFESRVITKAQKIVPTAAKSEINS